MTESFHAALQLYKSCPKASTTRVYNDTTSSNNKSSSNILLLFDEQCHGCGKRNIDNESTRLKRCRRCKRVYYCNQDCQIMDWKRQHKKYCIENLLQYTMDHLPNLTLEEKLLLSNNENSTCPNQHFSETITKVIVDNISITDIIQDMKNELDMIKNVVSIHSSDIETSVEGNTLTKYTKHNRYGLDIGVESLCIALNLWPNIYTIDSCSGVHDNAYIENPENSGNFYNFSSLVHYVSDNTESLARIHNIIVNGALGIQFDVQLADTHMDNLCNCNGFVCIESTNSENDNNNNNKERIICRTYCRRITVPAQPYDKLDCAVWLKDAREGRPRIRRMQIMIIGCIGLAINLIRQNAILSLSEDDIKTLNDIEHDAIKLRKIVIHKKFHKVQEKLHKQLKSMEQKVKDIEEENNDYLSSSDDDK